MTDEPAVVSDFSLTAAAQDRTHERKPVTWRTKLWLHDGRILDSKTTDISEAGLDLLCPSRFSIGLAVKLALQVPLTERGSINIFTAEGKVVFQIFRRPWISHRYAMDQIRSRCHENH